MNDTEEVPEYLLGTVMAAHSKLSDAWNDSMASYQKWVQDVNTPTTISSYNGVEHTDKEREDYARQQKALER